MSDVRSLRVDALPIDALRTIEDRYGGSSLPLKGYYRNVSYSTSTKGVSAHANAHIQALS